MANGLPESVERWEAKAVRTGQGKEQVPRPTGHPALNNCIDWLTSIDRLINSVLSRPIKAQRQGGGKGQHQQQVSVWRHQAACDFIGNPSIAPPPPSAGPATPLGSIRSSAFQDLNDIIFLFGPGQILLRSLPQQTGNQDQPFFKLALVSIFSRIEIRRKNDDGAEPGQVMNLNCSPSNYHSSAVFSFPRCFSS